MSRFPASSDLMSGLLFVLVGGGFVLLARNYEMGTAVAMGPGYFPIALGCGVVLIGLLLVGKTLLDGPKPDDVPEFHIRPGFFVLGAMVVFALALKPLGIMVAAALLIVIASLATPDRRWLETVLLACGLAIFSAIVFVDALGVPMPIWPRGF